MAGIVLDSFALLALLWDEPGSDVVTRLLERAGQRDDPVHMTEVNYAEVQYIIRREEGDPAWEAVARELVAAPIEFHPADRRLADLAADLKARHKISLADAPLEGFWVQAGYPYGGEVSPDRLRPGKY